MSLGHYDVIIVGTGISGLYSAWKIKQTNPKLKFLLLEQYKKQWIGGRTSNETFYDTEVVTGAGIGRKGKDRLLHALLSKDLHFHLEERVVKPYLAPSIEPVDVGKLMDRLRRQYSKVQHRHLTFREFASKQLGQATYRKLLLTAGYTDYENEDAYETLYYYGMEDNTCCWKSFRVPWRKMVLKLYHKIGPTHFKFSSKVVRIQKREEKPCVYQVDVALTGHYTCNRVILASTIDTLRTLLPSHPIYHEVHGQPFLRLYAKFTSASAQLMKRYVKGFTFVAGPLQRIVPMDADKGVYMIAYNDNDNARLLRPHLSNTPENRELYEELVERSLGMPEHSLRIVALKDYYWPIGTHYYSPLSSKYGSREAFLRELQRPEKGILVVGEAVSRNQGWTEGALESVEAVVTKAWIRSVC